MTECVRCGYMIDEDEARHHDIGGVMCQDCFDADCLRRESCIRHDERLRCLYCVHVSRLLTD